MADPRLIIAVCEKNDFVEDLALALAVSGNAYEMIEYVKRNPEKFPRFIGTCLDHLGTYVHEPLILELLSIAGPCDNKDVIQRFEKKEVLTLLHDWLKKVSVADKSLIVHTALGKVLVMLDQGPKLFLDHNTFYDRHRLGRFCENRG